MNSILRIVMGLVAGLLGLAFLTGLLAVLSVYIAFATVRWLVTGRKPQVVVVWNRFSVMRHKFRQGGFRASERQDFEHPRGHGAPLARDDQVVDVEVREVVEDAPRLPSDRRP